jgi:hypothetical protein
MEYKLNWEQAVQRNSPKKGDSVNMPIYWVEHNGITLVRVELDYKIGAGFQNSWSITIFGKHYCSTVGKIHDSEIIKAKAEHYLQKQLEEFNNLFIQL